MARSTARFLATKWIWTSRGKQCAVCNVPRAAEIGGTQGLLRLPHRSVCEGAAAILVCPRFPLRVDQPNRVDSHTLSGAKAVRLPPGFFANPRKTGAPFTPDA